MKSAQWVGKSEKQGGSGSGMADMRTLPGWSELGWCPYVPVHRRPRQSRADRPSYGASFRSASFSSSVCYPAQTGLAERPAYGALTWSNLASDLRNCLSTSAAVRCCMPWLSLGFSPTLRFEGRSAAMLAGIPGAEKKRIKAERPNKKPPMKRSKPPHFLLESTIPVALTLFANSACPARVLRSYLTGSTSFACRPKVSLHPKVAPIDIELMANKRRTARVRRIGFRNQNLMYLRSGVGSASALIAAVVSLACPPRDIEVPRIVPRSVGGCGPWCTTSSIAPSPASRKSKVTLTTEGLDGAISAENPFWDRLRLINLT
jgi:hypothetical protein